MLRFLEDHPFVRLVVPLMAGIVVADAGDGFCHIPYIYVFMANKKYTLEANDAAANKTTAKVATDAEGYLTITVEDEAFDTQTGAYTFSLNGMEINLYAEVERNIISATSEPVEKGQTAIVEIVTTSKVETVQLVSKTGTTTTKSEYTEDEDGNIVKSDVMALMEQWETAQG